MDGMGGRTKSGHDLGGCWWWERGLGLDVWMDEWTDGLWLLIWLGTQLSSI